VADLLFRRAAPASTDLVFGDTGEDAGLVSVSVTGSFQPLTVTARTAPNGRIHVTGSFQPLTVTATTQYRSNTARPTVGQTAHPWQLAQPAPAGINAELQGAQANPIGWQADWQRAAPAAEVLRHLLPDLFTPAPSSWAAPFQQATGADNASNFASQSGDRTLRLAINDAYEAAARLRHATLFGHQDGDRTQRGSLQAPWQVARPTGPQHSSSFQPARAALVAWLVRWQEGTPPRHGITLVPVPPTVPERIPSPDLLFACPPWLGGPVDLLFGRVCGGPEPEQPGETFFILPARFYMAVHSLTAQHLPSLAPVPIFDVSLSADAGSFAWTFSASAPDSVFDQLAPSAGLPAQIRITLDGLAFVFIVDSLQREEKFGQRGVKIAGRSATALLARPYAREAARMNIEARTAQQLAAEALDLSGAGLSWGLTDWLVPAGAWSHSGTPLAAVQAIVEAAGGYLQSHRSAATLLARHPYPTLPGGVPGGPWNWGGAFAPDVELAPDAIITAGIERRDGPDINAVYVSGTSQGVIALVKRIGTAGEKLAPMVTDPLITAPEAASQRGLSVLGAGGPKHLVSLSLPVLTGAGQPGVLDVGQLVQVNAAQPWRGRVRSVSVSAKLPSVRQTVALERHLEPV